jgi:cytochrome P450
LYNPDDPFAQAYRKITNMTPWTRRLNIAAAFLPFLMKLPFPRVLELRAARKSILQRSTQLVRDKSQTTGKDILSLMIAENGKADGQLLETEIMDQIGTFLLAGHETTSTAVTS